MPRAGNSHACRAIFGPAFFVLALLLAASAWPAAADELPPIAPDHGLAALEQAYLDLGTDLTILSFAAHPDDEDLETLAYYRRKHGLRTVMLLATRGEGGQNEIGSELYEELGVLRTRETEDAARLIGAEAHYLNFADFGFSKSAEETFERWGGKETVVKRVVEALRALRPDIIITNHGFLRDHGHHQACGIAIQEAFDRITRDGSGDLPVKKLYIRLPEGHPVNPEGTVAIDVGQYDPLRGATYAEMALAALRLHRSQGLWPAPFEWRAPKINRFIPVRSALEGLGEESDLTDGLPTLLIPPCPALDDGQGGTVPYPELETLIEAQAQERLRLAEFRGENPAAAHVLGRRLDRIARALAVRGHLHTRAVAEDGVLAPGESGTVRFEAFNGGARPVFLSSLEVASEWLPRFEVETPHGVAGMIHPGERRQAVIRVRIPAPASAEEAVFTRPEKVHWYSRTQTAPLFTIRPWLGFGDAPSSETLFLGPAATADPPLRPAVEISADPPDLPVIRGRAEPSGFTAHLVNNSSRGIRGARVRHVDPFSGGTVTSGAVDLPAGGGAATLDIRLDDGRATAAPGVYPVEVHAVLEGEAAPGLTPAPTATARIHVIDARVTPGVSVGLVKTYDDTVESALRALGVEFSLLDATAVRSGDLGRFTTIILDMRAYHDRPDVVRHNDRLLEYARRGGNLVVFYNKSFEWNRDDGVSFAPYPIELGRERVTDETAPVTILEPDHPLFVFPNRIGAGDFAGWVQERSLYLPAVYDPRYEELLECHDPGEPERRGGLLVARYGWGTYIYTAYVWPRQLRALHGGAFKAFANMISLPPADDGE